MSILRSIGASKDSLRRYSAFAVPFALKIVSGNRYPTTSRKIQALSNANSTLTTDRSSSSTRPANATPRVTRKAKVALFVGYDGRHYHGFQRNANVRAVVDDLEEACHNAGLISEANFGDLTKTSWTVAARTDKGVSAASNVVAFKAEVPKSISDASFIPKAMSAINEHLPPHIRVLRMSRVSSSFTARKHCDERNYEYLLIADALKRNGEEICLDKFNAILKQFEGTNPYHNYTIGRDVHRVPPPAQAFRYMKRVLCEDELTHMDGNLNTPLVRIRIRGQSFMLHQIRKMVTMAILVYLGNVPDNAIPMSFEKNRLINIPPAPSVGLFLDSCDFLGYNTKQEKFIEKPVTNSDILHACESFKQNVIFPSIASRMKNDDDCSLFSKTMQRHASSWDQMCNPE